ncbi:MAG: hypothetical protein ACE5H9_03865 [Anaerolineae bacterium]
MRVKLLLVYDIRPYREDEYYRFMIGEFLPTAQSVGFTVGGGWQTLYGDYPSRLFVLEAESQEKLREMLSDENWRKIEGKLKKLVTGYESRMVPWRPSFQFFRSKRKS